MFGLFDAPQLKAQRRAANSACSVRELAGREASIEAQMLAKRLHSAANQRETAFRDGRSELAGAITVALVDGQKLFDRMEYSIDPVVSETQQKWRFADSADQFEALVTYEQELRTLLIGLRDEARSHLGAINVATLAVTKPS